MHACSWVTPPKAKLPSIDVYKRQGLDHSPAARDEQAALGGEALEGLGLERAETLLALSLIHI